MQGVASKTDEKQKQQLTYRDAQNICSEQLSKDKIVTLYKKGRED